MNINVTFKALLAALMISKTTATLLEQENSQTQQIINNHSNPQHCKLFNDVSIINRTSLHKL
jgi:hypothetical protein